jgi:hypothetical protein
MVMGGAISAMHYTGMAAASFIPSAEPLDLSHAVSISSLGTVGIATVTLIVLGLTVLTSAADRRFSAQALDCSQVRNATGSSLSEVLPGSTVSL